MLFVYPPAGADTLRRRAAPGRSRPVLFLRMFSKGWARIGGAEHAADYGDHREFARDASGMMHGHQQAFMPLEHRTQDASTTIQGRTRKVETRR